MEYYDISISSEQVDEFVSLIYDAVVRDITAMEEQEEKEQEELQNNLSA